VLNKLFDDKIKSTETLTQYDNRKNDQYNSKKFKIKAKNFIQELLTTHSPVLKPNYGTNFIESLGSIINIYKFQYFLEKESKAISKKYNIQQIEISKVDSAGNMLIGHLEIFIEGNKVTHEFEIDWKGKTYTKEDIIE